MGGIMNGQAALLYDFMGAIMLATHLDGEGGLT